MEHSKFKLLLFLFTFIFDINLNCAQDNLQRAMWNIKTNLESNFALYCTAEENSIRDKILHKYGNVQSVDINEFGAIVNYITNNSSPTYNDFIYIIAIYKKNYETYWTREERECFYYFADLRKVFVNSDTYSQEGKKAMVQIVALSREGYLNTLISAIRKNSAAKAFLESNLSPEDFLDMIQNYKF